MSKHFKGKEPKQLSSYNTFKQTAILQQHTHKHPRYRLCLFSSPKPSHSFSLYNPPPLIPQNNKQTPFKFFQHSCKSSQESTASFIKNLSFSLFVRSRVFRSAAFKSSFFHFVGWRLVGFQIPLEFFCSLFH
ncbi:hypothetical protein L2E82_51092 [Cichorium intybus]|nr:hypothetical protein L2E82_51092 [Cichorium intybus]